MQAVVGRAEELAVIGRFVDDPLAIPRALLIEGEPGIGKSVLLKDLMASARERGVPVLSCRPSRAETDLSYVGLIELLGDLESETIDALPGPQAKVIRMILRREEPEGQFDRLSLYLAVSAMIRSLAADRPLVLAVDDAQWLDQPTARTLAYVVRRLSDTATRLAVVRRTGETIDWIGDLARAIPPDRLDQLTLAPIGPGDLSRILRRTLGWAPAWPRIVRIAELSGGNPLFALELTRAVGGVRSGEDLDGPLPDSVLELARARIEKLPDIVRETVEVASIPHAPTLSLMRQLCPPSVDTDAALADAERLGIVTIDGQRLRFAHPILAAAVYGSIPTVRRQRLHRAVAELATDLEERARHLARATDGPDSQVALALADAAELAWRRAAPAPAADLLRLACLRTPAAEADALALRRIAYGRLLNSAGDAPGGIAELESLVAALPAGLLRARALFHLMFVTRLSGFLGRAMEHGLQASAEAHEFPLFQAEVNELLSRLSDNDIERKLDLARKGVAAIDQVSDPDDYVVFHVRAALVEAEFYAGLGIRLDRLEGLPTPAAGRFPPVRTAVRGEDLIGRLLTYDGRIDEGLELLRGLYERALVVNRASAPGVLGWMAEAQLMAGRFEDAADLTREAIELAEQIGDAGGHPWDVGFHAVALALLGRLDQAESEASRVVTMVEADQAMDMDEAPARLALGLVYLGREQLGDAIIHLRQLDRAKSEAGIREPRFVAHAGELIEALTGAGELDEASAALTRLRSEAERTASPWTLAVSDRSAAIILAAQGKPDDAMACAQSAIARLATLPMPFERARTLLVIGQLHRRKREKVLARQALGEALQAFVDLRTPIWAERARAELTRIPLRRNETELTPTEETIARLAVEGLTNREIADRVFISTKTVEVNLTRIYRKLGVRSRTALARLLHDR